MANYGVLSTGFVRKPLAQIITDIQTQQLAGISANLNLQPPDPVAVLTGIFAGALDEVWQLGAALYNGMDPDQATGDQLASLALLTATPRLAATFTTVVGCTVTLAATFATAAPGTMFASIAGNPGAVFTNKAQVAYPGGGGNQTVAADFVAIAAGPTQALSGTLTTIASPLTGWVSITNPTAGAIGTAIELDAALRLRRQGTLAGSGSASAAAIRSAVLNQMLIPTTSSNTLSCTVLYNDTDASDSNGLPPHSIEVIAYQPGFTSDDDIALALLILRAKSAATNTWGTSLKVVTDPQGNSEGVRYTRPTPAIINTVITVKTSNPALVSASQVQVAITAYAAANWVPGGTVYFLGTESAALTVPGVVDVPVCTLNGGGVNIPIDVRSVAVIGSITVTVT